MHDPASFVDLEIYPIDQTGSAAFNRLISGIHTDLEEKGCAHLPGFVNQSAIEAIQKEADTVAEQAYRSYNLVNPYFTVDDPGLDPADPRRQFEKRSNTFVPADNFGQNSPLRALYEWQAFTDFIRISLSAPTDQFYCYDDPLADVIINVVDPGDGFPWHFDTNTFTVTLGIQPGQGGGIFQYSPNLRSPEYQNYKGVSDVLNGDPASVHSLLLEPGDLQIFLGRY